MWEYHSTGADYLLTPSSPSPHYDTSMMIANFLAIWIIMIYIYRVNVIYVVTDGANGAEKVNVHFIHVWLVENVPESAVESGRQVDVHSKKSRRPLLTSTFLDAKDKRFSHQVSQLSEAV